jgi:Zn-dependent protease
MIVGEYQGTRFMMRQSALAGYAATLVACVLLAAERRPRWSWAGKGLLGSAWFAVFQASYVLHSIGHVLSARAVGAPMQTVLLHWGFQINEYLDHQVTPQQHIGRASGGPLASGAGAASGYAVWRLLRRVPLFGDVAEAWFVSNLLIGAVSAAPTPHFDGASILKWAVAQHTSEPALGEEAVQQIGFAVVGGLLLTAAIFTLRGKVLQAVGAFGLAVFMVADLLLLRGQL